MTSAVDALWHFFKARGGDRSSAPFRQVIVIKDGNYAVILDPLPTWAKDILPGQ
jgi:hypothetical protein